MKFIKLLLSEGRREDFVNKFREKFSREDLKKIIILSQDIATNNKFLMFLGNALSPENVEGQLNDAKETINQFIRYQKALDQKDINQYKTLEDIKNAISSHENKVRRDVKELEGADQVYEDDRFTIVTPKTHKASCYYGAGTKWCTASMNGDSHFNRYNQDAKLFYIIDKKAKSSDRFYKVALLQKYDGEQTFFDAPDKSFNNEWILGTPEWEKMNKIIQNYMGNNFSREIEIFKDKERARIELERIRQQQERERRENKLRSQQERRDNDSWNLENNDTEEVRKVNAIFEHLKGEGDVDEDEGETIYNLIPADYSHYGLDTYEWVSNSGDMTFAVGTDAEADVAAEDDIRQRWDDLGAEAFSESFVESHLDTDEIYNYFYSFYYDDISENPDVYFDEDDLGLSEEQQKRIEEIEEEISEYEEEIQDYWRNSNDPDRDEDVVDDFERLIDELKEEMEEIESNPEGEVSEEKIDQLAEERAQYAKENPVESLNEMGMDISEYVDLDDLVYDVINLDGRGPFISSYDGYENEERINGEWYYIYRID